MRYGLCKVIVALRTNGEYVSARHPSNILINKRNARMWDDMGHVEVRVERAAIVADPKVLELMREALKEVLRH